LITPLFKGQLFRCRPLQTARCSLPAGPHYLTHRPYPPYVPRLVAVVARVVEVAAAVVVVYLRTVTLQPVFPAQANLRPNLSHTVGCLSPHPACLLDFPPLLSQLLPNPPVPSMKFLEYMAFDLDRPVPVLLYLRPAAATVPRLVVVALQAAVFSIFLHLRPVAVVVPGILVVAVCYPAVFSVLLHLRPAAATVPRIVVVALQAAVFSILLHLLPEVMVARVVVVAVYCPALVPVLLHLCPVAAMVARVVVVAVCCLDRHLPCREHRLKQVVPLQE